MIFHDEFKIYREKFGKITINKKNTLMEIKADSIRRIDKKTIKIGKNIVRIDII